MIVVQQHGKEIFGTAVEPETRLVDDVILGRCISRHLHRWNTYICLGWNSLLALGASRQHSQVQ